MSKDPKDKAKDGQDSKGKVPNAYEINPGMMAGLAEVTP